MWDFFGKTCLWHIIVNDESENVKMYIIKTDLKQDKLRQNLFLTIRKMFY